MIDPLKQASGAQAAQAAALLNHMPAMIFSKDARTGKYLSCNRAFAQYAHRDGPGDVVGLTDFDIFDGETAAHFAADDRTALEMDGPYVFVEDAQDAAGNPRRYQITKVKFARRITVIFIARVSSSGI